MVEILEEKFKDTENLDLIHQDILHTNVRDLVRGSTSYKVIANIPYYITGEILEKFLESDFQPKKMVLLLQKEVVDRIMERDNKGSILSKSIRVFGEPKYIKKVPSTAFTPSPKVDSAILAIEHISKNSLDGLPTEIFFNVLKTGFAHKRKKLIKNLEKIVDKNKLESVFEKLNLDTQIRPEKLSTEEWISLAKEIS
jgi:16S rRNA (adenine1518-N6/adenine1519-N6)-dimethyltransferase